MERFYELFCLFCRGILFLVTIRKQLTLERSNGFAAGSHVAAGLARPPFSNVPKCVLSPLTTSLYFVYFFLSRPRESQGVEILLSIGKISFDEEEEFVRRSIIFRQKLKVGWIDERSGDRQLPYSL